MSINDEISNICWDYISFKHIHWRDIIETIKNKTDFGPPKWLLGKAIRHGNIDAVIWCLNNLHSILDPHQDLNYLSDIRYDVLKYLFD
jgi:hypothetical protein